MKILRRYSDTIFLGLMILGLVFGSGVLLTQWEVIQDYWKTNFEKYSVPPEDIISGGTGRDRRIVPIDQPIFTTVSMVRTQFDDYAPMIVLDYHDVERAYPLNIMTAHEIVNDEIAGIPIAVTFCPMCNSAVVYRREVDGRALRMGG